MSIPCHRIVLLVGAAPLCLAVACGSTPRPTAGPVDSAPPLNDRLAAAAFASSAGTPPSDYRIGPGDVIAIDVFQAEELSRKVRVRPDGTIGYPLIGPLSVEGLTTASLEAGLAQGLGRDYLQDPQVSVFVEEYRAHPISILGEVHEPGIRYMREPRRLLSVLSESGGLTDEAGRTVQVRRKEARDGRTELVLLSIDLEELLAQGDLDLDLDLLLQDGDTVFVPKAGTVFVEGAVRKPGAYTLRGEGTVLKAVTLAGGFDFSAKESSVHLVRNARSGPEVLTVDVKAAKEDPSLDIAVQDGDVVVVSKDPVKVGLEGFWRGVTGLVRVSTGL